MNTAPAAWERNQPGMFSIVTGFFPETRPRDTWLTNPRPMLVCGVADDPETGMFFCRVAYGTTQRVFDGHDADLAVGNLQLLTALGLKWPTRFVLHSGRHMAILPWTAEFFHPWTGQRSPTIGVLPPDMQRFVAYSLGQLTDLPQF